jgi:hypothetical protein
LHAPLLLLCTQAAHNGRRLQQLGAATYIILASTSRDWQALQAAVASSSLLPLLINTVNKFGRGYLGYCEWAGADVLSTVSCLIRCLW